MKGVVISGSRVGSRGGLPQSRRAGICAGLKLRFLGITNSEEQPEGVPEPNDGQQWLEINVDS